MSEDRALSSRTQTALENAGIAPEEAAKMHPDDLIAVPGIGPVAIEEILGANGEHLEVERHDPAEAEGADEEHHPVTDPPHQMTAPIVPQGTRGDDAYGAATHVERINPRQVTSPGPDRRPVISYAPKEHPEGERRPYLTTRPSVVEGVRHEAGHLVWLLPYQVAAFHRPAK